jgi:uncharacterized protein YbjT (DUF2867 family)
MPTDSSAIQTVAVTGGTGFVGRHLVRELLDRGLSVRVLARDTQKAGRVLPEEAVTSGKLSIVVGDIFDDAALVSLLDGADACVHLIGIIREARNGQSFERMHVQAVERITAACARAGIRRYLHMSAVAADPEGKAKYQTTKFRGERVTIESGLDWTIFRPGLIHGPDGEFMGMARAWAEGRAAPFAFLPFFSRIEQEGLPGPTNPPRLVDPMVAPVHVDDVARAFADALTTPETIGEIYRLAGPETLSFPDMLRFVRDTVPHGKRGMPALGIPGVLAAAKATAAGFLGLGGLLPFDAGMALMGEKDTLADTTKAKIHLGFDPRPFRETAKAYLS